jgi:hypothetical protein
LPRRRWIVTTLLAIWLVVWVFVAWGANQDDAFIHLRYATFLHRTGFITYDGVHASYGTSSLLYVGLLSVLTAVTSSPLLPHAVSATFHIFLFLFVASWVLRPSVSAKTTGLFLVLLLLLTAPSAVRWLEDGMETSLVMFLVAIVVFHLFQQSKRFTPPPGDVFTSVLLGFLLVLLRTELVLLSVFASSILMLSDAGVRDSDWFARLLHALPRRVHYAVGSIFAAAFIRFTMGSFLPDTAMAKSDGIRVFFPTILNGFHVIGGALLFGVGIFLLWVLSAVLALRIGGPRQLATLLANALFPLLLFLAALRGQKIQGVRYLIWAIFFSVCWNLFELARVRALAATELSPAVERSNRAIAVACVALCMLALGLDARVSYRTLRTRVHTFRAFNGQNLAAALPGELGIAGDVGYISYFTHDTICDTNGLVNGRAFAALTDRQRVAHCVASHPAFLFVLADQAKSFARSIDLTGWKVCGVYDFGNTGNPDRHYLIVRPDRAAATCSATSFQPQPVTVAFIGADYPTH